MHGVESTHVWEFGISEQAPDAYWARALPFWSTKLRSRKYRIKVADRIRTNLYGIGKTLPALVS